MEYQKLICTCGHTLGDHAGSVGCTSDWDESLKGCNCDAFDLANQQPEDAALATATRQLADAVAALTRIAEMGETGSMAYTMAEVARVAVKNAQAPK